MLPTQVKQKALKPLYKDGTDGMASAASYTVGFSEGRELRLALNAGLIQSSITVSTGLVPFFI